MIPIFLFRYVGSKVVSFLTTVCTIYWVFCTLIFLIPMRTFLQISLVVLSNWLPPEGIGRSLLLSFSLVNFHNNQFVISIEIDSHVLKWIGPPNKKRLALMKNLDETNDVIVTPGAFLVSRSDHNQSSYFSQSVILVTKVSDDFTEGLIIGGSSIPKLTQDNLQLMHKIENGGPVNSNTINILHNNANVMDADHVIDDVYVSTCSLSSDAQSALNSNKLIELIGSLDRPLHDKTISSYKAIFYGSCRWASGQLESEITLENMWHLVRVQNVSKFIFSCKRSLWEKLNDEIQ